MPTTQPQASAVAGGTMHTPGPWRVAPASAYADGRLNIDAGVNGLRAFICLAGRRGDPEAQANARLISVAPDYDDAAQCYMRWVEHFKDEIPESIRNAMEAAFGAKLRAAISKAEVR